MIIGDMGDPSLNSLEIVSRPPIDLGCPGGGLGGKRVKKFKDFQAVPYQAHGSHHQL